MIDSKWPDTRELWLCLNCGSVEWHLRGEGKAILCECVAGVWTTMEQVWPAPSGWISMEDRLPERDHAYLVRIQEDGWEWFDVDDWRGRWYWATESGYESQLTHWMEIPELPEDVRHE